MFFIFKCLVIRPNILPQILFDCNLFSQKIFYQSIFCFAVPHNQGQGMILSPVQSETRLFHVLKPSSVKSRPRQLYDHYSRRPRPPASVTQNSFKKDFQTTKESEIWDGTFIQPNLVNQLTSQPPASLPEMPWLALIFWVISQPLQVGF